VAGIRRLGVRPDYPLARKPDAEILAEIDLLLREFLASRMILAALDIAKADVDGGDPLVREDLHVELARVLGCAAADGLAGVYHDAVGILEALADVEAQVAGTPTAPRLPLRPGAPESPPPPFPPSWCVPTAPWTTVLQAVMP